MRTSSLQGERARDQWGPWPLQGRSSYFRLIASPCSLKQLIPPELPQVNIQRRAEKGNLCGKVDTPLVNQEFSPRWSTNWWLTKSSLFPPTLGMLFSLSTVSRAVLEGFCMVLMSLRACHSSKIPFYLPCFNNLVCCSPHEHLIQNDMRRELPAQIKLLFIEQ